MPVKHINEETWRKVEKKTVEAIIKKNKSIKEGEMLNRLILIGLKHYDEEQFEGEKKRLADKARIERHH